MRQNRLENDRVVNNVGRIVEQCLSPYSIEVLSIVLYGSKARGDRNTQNDYEILVLVNNATTLDDYIKFTNLIRLELLKEKFFNVKILVYTPDVFEDTLYHDKIVGTFLYMILREHIIIYDKFGTFVAIRERMVSSKVKSEEEFLAQCIEFSRMLGSEKWEHKWEKKLMQFRYLKKRRYY